LTPHFFPVIILPAMPNPKKPPVSPLLVITIGILAVSTSSIFIRYAQVYADSLVIAAYRLVLASLVLAPVALTRQRAELRSLSRREFLLGGISGVFLAIHFGTWISSLEYTTVASSVVLVTTTPLWVALMAPLLLRERLQPLVFAGIFLAMLGSGIVGLADTCTVQGISLTCPPLADFVRGRAFLGDLLALAGALAAAGYIIIGRRLRARLSLVGYIFVVYGFAALTLLAYLPFAGLPLFGYPPQAYLLFLLLGLVPQLIGHSSFNWALGYLPAAIVSITLLGEPVGATILALLILQETPTPLKLAGAALILGGILISTYKRDD
jgi:drug/metabolite transporter (DMT)-like permease